MADTKSGIDIKSLNLYQKLAAITGEIGIVAKDGRNREQGYGFIEYSAVAGALRTLFGKYAVMCVPTMGARTESELTGKSGGRGYRVLIDFTFTFINGDKPEEREVIQWVGEAIDYGDKATNKAATSALKYCLMRTFNVSDKGEEDPDSHSPEVGEPVVTHTVHTEVTAGEPVTPKQKILIASKLTELGIRREDMQGYLTEQYGVTHPEQMTKADASMILDALMGKQS